MAKNEKHDPSDYGSYFYIVRVVPSIAEDGIIGLYADAMKLNDNGDLVFLVKDGKEFIEVFFIAKGNWKAPYLADPKFHFPLNIKWWQGVAGIKTIFQHLSEDDMTNAVMDFFKTNDELKLKVMEMMLEEVEESTTPEETIEEEIEVQEPPSEN
ncbi:MAG: hypothetical protein RBR32_03675 [Bacteroidales bacterium]|nr:hypothetical protein [Bacteroidales bacterium]